MPGWHTTGCSQCTHSLSRYTQIIPGLQRHSGFRSLAQAATSSKPSTGRERRGRVREGPGSQLYPSSRWIPTHQGHRSGRAGRWRDGSRIHCSNYRGKSRKLCLGCGCIQRRQTCLGGKRGIRRQDSISAACCLPQSPSLASLSLSRVHGYAATSSNLSGPVTMANASPVPLSHLGLPVLVSFGPTSPTRASWGHCSHLGDSGSSRRDV